MQDCLVWLRSYYDFQLYIFSGMMITLAAYEGMTAYVEHRTPFQDFWSRLVRNDLAAFLCLISLGFVWIPVVHCVFQCKASDKEATLVLLTNSLLIANHLLSVAALLLAGIGGPLERVAFFGGTLFLSGMALSDGAWPPLQRLWPFWGVPVGIFAGVLELYHRRRGPHGSQPGPPVQAPACSTGEHG